jgi:hypothetical protein
MHATKIRIRLPAACTSRFLRTSTEAIGQPGPSGHTQTPGATPRKDFRIPELGAGVNEMVDVVACQFSNRRLSGPNRHSMDYGRWATMPNSIGTPAK